MFKPAYVREASPVQLTMDRGATVARMECKQCGGHDEWKIVSRRPPADILKKHFNSAGWLTQKRLCPTCQLKGKSMSNVAHIKPEGTKVESTEGSKRIKRMVYMALEDYYDDAKNCYKDGKTDKLVAEEIGTSENFVERIREQDFGPLAEPDAFAAIRKEASEIASQIGKLQAKLDAMSNRNGWKG